MMINATEMQIYETQIYRVFRKTSAKLQVVIRCLSLSKKKVM